MRENPPRDGGRRRMGFGIRMMTKAWAWVRAFVAPRRSRVVNSGAEGGLRNPGVVVRRRGASRNPRIAGSTGATRARHPRHDENDPVFDKIRQIHGLIPQIRSFFRQIQDPSERGKNIKSLKINGLCEKAAPGGGISQGRGVCAHPPALAPRRHPAGGVRERPAPPTKRTIAGLSAHAVKTGGSRAAPTNHETAHGLTGNARSPPRAPVPDSGLRRNDGFCGGA